MTTPLERLARATTHINFGCNFDKKGQCTSTRKYGKNKHRNGMACCYACRSSLGYFSHDHPNEFERVAHLFDEKTGFWRKGQGCIIPREQRSRVCVTFVCGAVAEYNDIFKQTEYLAKRFGVRHF